MNNENTKYYLGPVDNVTPDKHQRTLAQNNGFSAFELLATILIIVTLMGIVSFWASTLSSRAVQAACEYELKLAKEAVEIYALLNDGNYPNSTEEMIGIAIEGEFGNPTIRVLPGGIVTGCGETMVAETEKRETETQRR